MYEKKKLLSFLVLISLFMITGCGNSDNWDLSLTSKEYAMSYCRTLESGFLTSATTYMKDDSEYYCSQENPSKDKFLLFEIKGEYTGSSVYSDYLENFELVYGKDYKVTPESVYISIGDSKWIYIDGTAVNNNSISIDPLEKTEFIIRGAFDINSRIETDTSQSLVLKTPFGEEFNLR